MSLVHQSLYAASAALVLAGSRFLLAAIVARQNEAPEFGAFVYAQWLVDISFLLVSFGVTGVVSRFVAEYQDDISRLDELLRSWPKWSFIIPLLAGIAALLGALLSGIPMEFKLVVPLAAWSATAASWALHTAILTGLQRFQYLLAANLVAGVIMVLGAWFAGESDEGLPILYWAMAVASAAAALMGAITLRRACKSTKVPFKGAAIDWANVRRYALNMWVISLLWSLVWSRGELPVVKYYTGAAGVAQYGAIQTLFGGAMQGVMLGLAGAAPRLTYLWGNEQRDDALSLAKNLLNLQLVICGSAALILTLFGPELLHGVFGANYKDQAGSLSILSIGLVSMVFASQAHILQIETNGVYTRNSALVGLVLLFGISVAAISSIGVPGAAAARSSVMAILGIATLVVFCAQWGARHVSILNCALVVLVVGLSAIAVNLFAEQNLPLRAALFCASIAVLAAFMRAPQGDNFIALLLQKWRS